MAFAAAVVLGRFQNGGAQCGCQRQRHKHRESHGRHDGDGELAVDHARGATKESHGHEHGRQRHADTHQRRRDFMHGLARGLLGRLARLVHHTLDVFHHHNGVVHQQANRQHHGKHGQSIDRIPGHRQHTESAQQHHGHGNCGNQRGAEVLQEDEHHDHHQHHGLTQGADHLVNRSAHKRRGVRADEVINLVREIRLELGQLGGHSIRDGHGVGAIGQNNAHARAGHAVELGLN